MEEEKKKKKTSLEIRGYNLELEEAHDLSNGENLPAVWDAAKEINFYPSVPRILM